MRIPRAAVLEKAYNSGGNCPLLELRKTSRTPTPLSNVGDLNRPTLGRTLLMKPTIVLFSKAPAQESKPLALGQVGATRWHQTLLERTLIIARRTGAPVLLVSDDPRADLPQRGQGFEERLLNALDDVAALGVSRVCLIGSDTPALNETILNRALATPPGQICVGPSQDGGFYLLAMELSQRGRLRGLPWRQQSVLGELLKVMPNAALLPWLCDVDDWRGRLKTQRIVAPANLSELAIEAAPVWSQLYFALKPAPRRQRSSRGPPPSV